MTHLVDLIEISKGKNENHICFKGHISRLNPSTKYWFDFIGSDIDTNAPLTDFAKNNLVECLSLDFGYAPFDFKHAKEIFDKGKEYNIELWDD